mmetsp:Transcript_50182/g.162447  ORF Transcript_50182/g.162447 Transcript_50182/m.162447 type:complete len:360 (-) Transcript_50182:3632-4711(-)
MHPRYVQADHVRLHHGPDLGHGQCDLVDHHDSYSSLPPDAAQLHLHEPAGEESLPEPPSSQPTLDGPGSFARSRDVPPRQKTSHEGLDPFCTQRLEFLANAVPDSPEHPLHKHNRPQLLLIDPPAFEHADEGVGLPQALPQPPAAAEGLNVDGLAAHRRVASPLQTCLHERRNGQDRSTSSLHPLHSVERLHHFLDGDRSRLLPLDQAPVQDGPPAHLEPRGTPGRQHCTKADPPAAPLALDVGRREPHDLQLPSRIPPSRSALEEHNSPPLPKEPAPSQPLAPPGLEYDGDEGARRIVAVPLPSAAEGSLDALHSELPTPLHTAHTMPPPIALQLPSSGPPAPKPCAHQEAAANRRKA